MAAASGWRRVLHQRARPVELTSAARCSPSPAPEQILRVQLCPVSPASAPGLAGRRSAFGGGRAAAVYAAEIAEGAGIGVGRTGKCRSASPPLDLVTTSGAEYSVERRCCAISTYRRRSRRPQVDPAPAGLERAPGPAGPGLAWGAGLPSAQRWVTAASRPTCRPRKRRRW